MSLSEEVVSHRSLTNSHAMDSTSRYANSKRPPKLRSACNECHAAKVRCSGEKTGCQRCGNLRLKCAFSISRIGKVPGKRSKANRVTTTGSNLASAPISTSSSSMSTTPIMSPPILTPTHSFESPRTYSGRSSVAIPQNYPFTHEYPASTLPVVSEANHPHLPPRYPPQSHPEDLSNLSNLCWTAELDQLGGPGLLSPDWEIDADESNAPQSHQTSTTYPDPVPDEHNDYRTYASPTEIFPSVQYPIYIHLLHSIEQTIQFSSHCRSPGAEGMHASTLDSVLAASQRYLTTLSQIADSAVFTHTYNEEHLLFSVALDKIIYLFTLGYADFRRRMEVYERMGMNCAGQVDRWMRFGAFEVDFVEQTAMCQRVFVEEVKRARACLGRLMDAMGVMVMPLSTSPGRHEGLCEEMKKRLDGLRDELEVDHGVHGRVVG
ncbi:hypothetical protein BJX99DRAFT_259732 [Aspergillus californicus]